MSGSPSYDPELLALLEEVARDPDAQVLRPYRPGDWRGIRGITDPISPRTTGLTSAEREIADVYREEAARVLIEYGGLAMEQRPRIWDYTLRGLTVDRSVPSVDAQALLGRTTTVLERTSADSGTDWERALGLIRDCGAGRFLSIPPRDLFLASLRLYPRDSARLWVALSLAEQGEWSSAIRVCSGILAGTPGDLIASCAWEWIGLGYAKTGRMRESLEAYKGASSTSELRPAPLAFRLSVSCCIQATDEALDAGRSLDDMVGPDHPSVAEVARILERTWRPDAEAVDCIEGLQDQLGPASRRITYAALS